MTGSRHDHGPDLARRHPRHGRGARLDTASVLRRPALVRGVAVGNTARAALVADHVHLLGELLHHHHTGEDRLLWPVLQPRVPADVAPTVERMEAQHNGIAQAQAAVSAALPGWRAGAGEAAREALATALEESCTSGSPSTSPRRSSTSCPWPPST
jgi:hypothetical protein